MKSVIFRAPALTQSGYGVHARQVASWLIDLASQNKIDLYIQLTRWGNTPFFLDRNACDGLIGKILSYTREYSKTQKADVSIQLILPNEWDSTVAEYNIGMSAIVETDRCNPKWIDACNSMDMVIVPSEHALNTLKKSGQVTSETHIVPEAFIDEILTTTNI
jgi:hypothetical protein